MCLHWSGLHFSHGHLPRAVFFTADFALAVDGLPVVAVAFAVLERAGAGFCVDDFFLVVVDFAAGFVLEGVCASALAAADFELLLVRLSVSVFEAAVALFGAVAFFAALVWETALPAADFEFFPVEVLLRVLEALLAAFA